MFFDAVIQISGLIHLKNVWNGEKRVFRDKKSSQKKNRNIF